MEQKNARPESANYLYRVVEYEPHVYLATLARTLNKGKWLIAGVTSIILGGVVLYLFAATPIYKTDALLQLKAKENSGLSDLDTLSTILLGDQSSTAAEIEIIRSRQVIGKAAERLNLDIQVDSNSFLFWGTLIARRYGNDPEHVAEPPVDMKWLSSFNWGGEHIQIDQLNTTSDYFGKRLTLVAEGNNSYLMLDENDAFLLKGMVGTLAHTEGKPAAVSILVSELRARKNSMFFVQKKSLYNTVLDLQEQIEIVENGSNTGIVKISLEGRDPDHIAVVVNTVADVYIKDSFNLKSMEIEGTLAFIESQLPLLKDDLDAAETALNVQRSKQGNIDLEIKTKALVNQLAELETLISMLELSRIDYKKKFTGQHGDMIVLEQKIKQLKNTRASLEKQFANLPDAQLGSIRVERDMKVAEQVYLLLLNEYQELKVAKAGIVGNARIVDNAIVSDEPVKPKKMVIALIGLMAGLFSGITFTLFKAAFLSAKIDDIEVLEQHLPVYAMIPNSPEQVQISKKPSSKILAATNSKDIAIESLRSLRTSVQFILAESLNNIITINGSVAGAGKSFVALNFSYVWAEAGKRILLIDADMRRGNLQQAVVCTRSPGLSDVINGKAQLSESIQTVSMNNIESEETENQQASFSFLATGILPPNPSELLLSRQFANLLDTVSKQFDIVIVDTTPVLNVADSAIISRLTGVNFLVIRAGQQTVRDVKMTIKHLNQAGANIQGAIFNGIKQGRTGYDYGPSYKY